MDLAGTRVDFTKKNTVPPTTKASGAVNNLANFVDQRYAQQIEPKPDQHFTTKILSLIPNDSAGTITITYQIVSRRGQGISISANKTATVHGFYSGTQELQATTVT